MLKINEIFESYQGEGFNQGKKVLFVRFAFCNLKCPWCDTNFNKFYTLSEEELFNIIISKTKKTKSVIFTGGEPTLQLTETLVRSLKNKDIWTGIETNGLIKPPKSLDYISVSPKKLFDLNFYSNEIRIVNTKYWTKERLLELEERNSSERYYLSPLEVKGKFNIQKTLRLLNELSQVSSKNWHLSLQIHKIFNFK